MNPGMTARRTFFCLQNIASMLDLQLKPHTNEQKLICDWTNLFSFGLINTALITGNIHPHYIQHRNMEYGLTGTYYGEYFGLLDSK